tara:strand:+ start:76 stop:474 length:399 start_codon:yes stop_codon:yes gene_type:complete
MLALLKYTFLLTSMAGIIESKSMVNDDLMGSATLTNKGNVIDFTSVDPLSAIILPDKEANSFIKDTSLRGGDNRRRLANFGAFSGSSGCHEEWEEGWSCGESTLFIIFFISFCVDQTLRFVAFFPCIHYNSY